MLVTDALLIALVSIAAVTDLLERRIYNLVTMPALLAGLALQTAAGAGWSSLGGALLAGLPFFLLFALGKMAAGDVKLLMAIGALGGIQVAVGVVILSTLLGGGVALASLVVRRRLGDLLLLGRPIPGGSLTMPFGVPIAAATFIVVGIVSSGGLG